MLTQMRIDNRIDSFLGRPGGADRRPAVIHLHERYGIVQHTTDLAHRLVEAGYVTVVPELFWRFTGDRQALARGDSRVELCDAEVLQDVDAIVAYLRTLPDVDASRIAMIGVCQTGRQPVLVSASRDYLAGIVVMYGAIYNADWESQPLRPEPIDRLLEQISCPVQGIFGELDNLVPLDNVLRMCSVLASARKSFDVRVYAEAPHGFLNDTMPGRYRAARPRRRGARFSAFWTLYSIRGGTENASAGVSRAIPRSTTISARTGVGSSRQLRCTSCHFILQCSWYTRGAGAR